MAVSNNPDINISLKDLPPQELEAEVQVLGACLLDRNVLAKARIQPKDFYRTVHGKIFEAMRRVYDAGEAVDLITVSAALRGVKEVEQNIEGGASSYLVEIVSQVPTAAGFTSHENLVIAAAQRRAILRVQSDLYHEAHVKQDPDKIISDCINRLNEIRRHDNSTLLSYRELMQLGFGEIERRYVLAKEGKLPGIPTGFRDLDRKLHGFQPQLYILAGASGMGKSALADGFVRAAARHFLREWEETLPEARPERMPAAGILSLEMSPPQLSLRAISSESEIPLSRLLAGTIQERDWPLLSTTAGKISELPIFAEFTAFSDRQVERTIDDMVQRLGVRLLEVDYSQLISCEDHEGTREQEVSKILRLFKRKVKEHRLPIIDISSLKKGLSTRTDKRPTNDDLRESGNFEYDADVIMFVYRDEMYNCKCPRSGPCMCERRGKAEVIISKGRTEGLGTVELEWHTNTTTFRDGAEG
jgi:replicative DNA helicase